MAVREIVYMGDPVLRQEAAPVESFDPELETLVQEMFETMYHAEGIGLAAPQIGLSRRVMVLDIRERDEEWGGPFALVNPRVIEASKERDRASEGCLSIPGLEEVVERPSAVKVHGFGVDGGEVTIEAEGLLARALQHEIDHLDGILFVDRVSPIKRRMLLKKWRKLQAEPV